MSLRFSRKIALRYLWSRRAEAFITIITIISILGVAIGVMVLNIVMAVMTGFEYELRDKIVGTNSHIVVRRLGGKIEGWEKVSEALAKIDGVSSVSPYTYHQGLLRTDSGASGILIRGIAEHTAGADQLAHYMEKGQDVAQLFRPQKVKLEDSDQVAELPGLIIGKELARSSAILVGTPVSLLSPQVGSTPFGLMPRFRRFVVAGSYSSGLVEYENGLAYAKLEDAQKFFGMGSAVSGLEIRVKDIEQSAKLTRTAMELLTGIGPGFYAEDWTEQNKPLWDAIRLEKKVYFLVLLLIIVMASFSIITTLIMIVLEKRKDIAVLKTMGASTADVSNIFRLQGAVIGGIGTTAGLLGGYLGCLMLKRYGFPIDERIFQMSTLPIRIEPVNFIAVGIAAFAICCVATIYPALRASRLQPSDVLRHE
ncbi:MAG: ABC transporter permease [Oligoflexia bacterium]|nr:ABC transporter permease [Oligoflexia bacterium]